jgi:polysaccharide deacetylase 2 family uncharacterized protein YibQ
LATDDLDTPLGKSKKTTTRKLPVTLPQVVAGILGLCVVVVGVLTVQSHEPYGGEPVAVVAPTILSGARAEDQNVATATRTDASAAKPVNGAAANIAAEKTPPGSKVITITDGSTGKAQQVVVPPRPGDRIAKQAADPKLLEKTRHGDIPKVAPDGARPSAFYARPIPAGARPEAAKIAIVVGGLGVSVAATNEALDKLPGPITLAFAPYGGNLDELAARARAADHEVLLQAPMEPFDYPDNDPGPQTLLTTLTPDQNIDRLHWLMSRMQGYVGIASLMGARFTASGPALTPVLQEIGKRGLIYLDDGSSTRSVAGQVAGGQNLSFAKTDIVLDSVPAPAEIGQALARLELAAKERGSAIGFASATPASIARIAEWAKSAQSRGFTLVPISMVAAKPKSS